MRKILLMAITGMILAGCSPSSELQVAWKTGEYPPKHFSNIGILALFKSNEARIDVENGVADALRAKGIHATTTWDIWPFANNKEIVDKMGYDQEKIKEVIQQKVAEQKMDALLIITLFDAFKEERYVPGQSVSLGVVGYSPGMYPVYGYPYYGYYGYAYNIMTTPGYYVDASTYFVESNLYDISTEQLIWTGQSSTQIQFSLETEAAKLGRILVKGMIQGKVLENG